MKKNLPMLAISLGLSSFILISCVDNSYDLEKDISLDMNLGGDSVSIPVGNTDTIRLSDFIDPSGMLVVDESGLYSIMKSDEIDPVKVNIDPVTVHVDDIEFEPLDVDFQTITSGTETSFRVKSAVTIGPLYASIDRSSSFDVNEEVPEEISSIKTATFKEGTSPKLNLTLKFEGVPSDVDRLTFDQLKLTLPSFLVFAGDVVVDGVLTLDGEDDAFDPHEGFTRTLTLTGFDFSGMNGGEGLVMQKVGDKNMLIIDSDNEVSLKGGIKTGEVTVGLDELQNITITPLITVDDLQIAGVTGKADPEIDPVRQSIAVDLGSDVDFLKDSAYLDLHNPLIYLTIGNTTGIPVDLSVDMYAKNNDEVVSGSQVDQINLKVNAADVDGEETDTRFLISRQGTAEDGYETVQAEDLSNLLKVIPDSIIMAMNASADQDETHHVDLTKKMEITGSYEVLVPFRFDSVNINYQETIDGLKDDLSDVSENVKNLGINVVMTVENSIPLELTLTVRPLRSTGTTIHGITTTVSGTIPAGTATGSVSKKLTVYMTDENNELEDLDALELNIKATSSGKTEGGVELNANQFVRLTNISLQINGGIDVDLND